MQLLDVKYCKKEDASICVRTIMPHDLANISFMLKSKEIPESSIVKNFIQPMFAIDIHFVSFPMRGALKQSSFNHAYIPAKKSHIVFFSPKLLAPILDELPEESVATSMRIENADYVLSLLSPLYNIISPDEVREYWHQAAFVVIEEGTQPSVAIDYLLPDYSKAILHCSLSIENDCLAIHKKELLCFKENIGEQLHLIYTSKESELQCNI